MFNENGSFNPTEDLRRKALDEYPLLKGLLSGFSPRSHEEKVSLRRQFVESGLFGALNKKRMDEGEEPYKNVAQISLLDIEQELERYLTSLNEVVTFTKDDEQEQDDDQEPDESQMVHSPNFEAMSQGPEARRKSHKDPKPKRSSRKYFKKIDKESKLRAKEAQRQINSGKEST